MPPRRWTGPAMAADAWLREHAGFVRAAGWTAFALVCADYGGVVDLPRVVDVPARLGVALAALRYALWDGLLKPGMLARIEAERRAGEASSTAGTAAPEQAFEVDARKSGQSGEEPEHGGSRK